MVRSSTEREGDMSESISLGLNELSIPPGTHICAFFRGIPERDEILIPFLREGLRSGDKCMCLIDDGLEAVRAALAGEVAPATADRQLDIQPSKSAYLRRGAFLIQDMLD